MQAVEAPNQNHFTEKLKQSSQQPPKNSTWQCDIQIEDQRQHALSKDKQLTKIPSSILKVQANILLNIFHLLNDEQLNIFLSKILLKKHKINMNSFMEK